MPGPLKALCSKMPREEETKETQGSHPQTTGVASWETQAPLFPAPEERRAEWNFQRGPFPLSGRADFLQLTLPSQGEPPSRDSESR